MKGQIVFFLTAVLISVAFTHCSSKPKEKAIDPKTIVDPNNRQDTVYFGYIFGQKTQNITDRLIKEGQFNSNSQVRKTYRYMHQNLILSGYPFDFCVDDKKYDALLILADNEGNFIEKDGTILCLYIDVDGWEKYSIINALKKQYGDPHMPPKVDGYKVFVPDKLEAFWNISNKAVYLEDMGDFMILVYEDIIGVADKKNKEATEKAAAEAAEKQKNMERSRNTPL